MTKDQTTLSRGMDRPQGIVHVLANQGTRERHATPIAGEPERCSLSRDLAGRVRVDQYDDVRRHRQLGQYN